MVAGKVGFALGAVDDDGVDRFGVLRGQLDRRRETGAAHADDAGVPDDLPNLVGGKRLVIPLCAEAFYRRILPVVFNDDCVAGLPHDRHPGLNLFNRPGNRGADPRRNHAVRLSDLLAHQHPVAGGDDRFRRRADMLAERVDHLPFGQNPADGAFLRQLLLFPEVDAPQKSFQVHR